MANKQNDLAAVLNQNPRKLKHEETPVAAVEQPKKKGKVGRPKTKTEPTKTINIAVPISILEQMEIAKLKYNDNLTKYVNEVIVKDLETNMDAYKQIYELLKQ